MSTSEAIIPAHRLSFGKHGPKIYKALVHLENTIDLDPALFELVKLRASVINGCSYCVDLHTRTMIDAGEDPRRIASVAAWRHAAFFTARERAALTLTDAMTRLGDEGVTHQMWEQVSGHFTPDELANLIGAIIAINSWNRLAVTLETIPDDIRDALT